MAVTRSPWANLPNAVQGKLNIGTSIKPSEAVSPTPNRDDLDKALITSLEKIALDPKMTPKQKEEAAYKAYQIAKNGESKPSLWGNIVGGVGTVAKKALSPVVAGATWYSDKIKPLTNTAMAFAYEVGGSIDAWATMDTENQRLGKDQGGFFNNFNIFFSNVIQFLSSHITSNIKLCCNLINQFSVI
jgi:hypothetical protein